MDIIVISDCSEVFDEVNVVNELFFSGMNLFHLRKNDWSVQKVSSFLNKINPNFYSKIVLHQHHQIAQNYGIRRLHFKEVERLKYDKECFLKLNDENFILSTSVHNLLDFSGLMGFNYSFIGPVFDSISKKNYPSMFKSFKFDKSIILKNNLCALGGINDINLSIIKKYGFNKAAVLGYLWNNPKTAVDNYLKLLKNV